MNETFPYSPQACSQARKGLLSLLFAAQAQQGHLSPEAIDRIASCIGLTGNQVYSFASFFPWLRLSPEDCSEAGLRPGAEEPAAGTDEAPSSPAEAGQVKAATRRLGLVNPSDLADYLDQEGFQGLEKALAVDSEVLGEMVAASGLDEANDFGLSCQGQWRVCRQTPADQKNLICSAVAHDPISLIESSLLAKDPFAVLEGMLIAGYATGASQGIVYLDGRNPQAMSDLRSALDQMEASGSLGNGILGSGFSFHVELIPAAGPAPCDEASIIIAALEGRRPDNCSPRHGSDLLTYMGQPAVIHSVETLAKLPAILGQGADWYAALGRNGCKGTKLVTLAGSLQRRGLAEVPMGISLREIINHFGGGVSDSEVFKAVQVGGPTGGWLGAEDLDIALSGQALKAVGTRLGSGSLVAVDQGSCAVELARQALLFAAGRSCGHCNICREGTRQMAEILRDIILGRSETTDLELLEELSGALQLGSSCNLGRTAPQAFLTMLERFRQEYHTHLKDHRCAAGSCRESGHDFAIHQAQRHQ